MSLADIAKKRARFCHCTRLISIRRMYASLTTPATEADHECRILHFNVAGRNLFRQTIDGEYRRWTSLSVGLYTSLRIPDRTSAMGEFKNWSVAMLAIEPSFEQRWKRLGLGTGGSLFLLEGGGFDFFANGAVKIDPSIRLFDRWVLNVPLRWIPKPFTAAQFGKNP